MQAIDYQRECKRAYLLTLMFLTLSHHCCRRRHGQQPPSQGSLRGCLRLLCLQKPNRLPSLVLSFSPLHNWQTVSFSTKASLPALASSEMVRKKDINDIFRFLQSPGQARNCNPFLHNVRFVGNSHNSASSDLQPHHSTLTSLIKGHARLFFSR